MVAKPKRSAILRHCAHDLLRCSIRDRGLNFHRHLDGSAAQNGKMLDDFFRNTSGVSTDTKRINFDRAMKPCVRKCLMC